jgi:pSer/pThr/pTyr-binding forkhead associated (FHA) protein
VSPTARKAYLVRADHFADFICLEADTLTLGRSECDIVLNNPTVSRRHAVLKRTDRAWIVEDLGSANGTWVNGRRISRSMLGNGDHLALGEARFFFCDEHPLTPIEPRRDATALRPRESAPANSTSSAVPPSGRLLDRILALSPREFEEKTAALFMKLGFESIVTKQSADGGVDVTAVNNGVIFRGKYLIQCKRYSLKNKVTRPELNAFFGRVASEPGTRGIFVTSSSFTGGATKFAQNTGINLIDGEELEKLFLRHRLL